MDKHRSNKSSWAGIILVVLGLAFLLKNLNLFYFPSYLFSWKTLLIGIGLVALALGKRDGFIPLAIGAFFLLVHDILNIHINFRQLWPVALIIIGIVILIRRRGPGSDRSDEISANFIDEVAIFSGLEKKVVSSNFQGGKTSAVFGGADIDLSKANLSPGHNVIDIFAMFGGTTFKVPADWTVNITELTVLFGGFADERVIDSSQTDPAKVLNLKGVILFGGGELRNG